MRWRAPIESVERNPMANSLATSVARTRQRAMTMQVSNIGSKSGAGRSSWSPPSERLHNQPFKAPG